MEDNLTTLAARVNQDKLIEKGITQCQLMQEATMNPRLIVKYQGDQRDQMISGKPSIERFLLQLS